MKQKIKIEVRRNFEVLFEKLFDEGEKVVVGRLPESDILLDTPDISRHHLTVNLAGEHIVVQNHSPNGFNYDGRIIDGEIKISFGKSFNVGAFNIKFLKIEQNNRKKLLFELPAKVLKKLINHVDLSSLDNNSTSLRPRVKAAILRIIVSEGFNDLPDLTKLINNLTDEALGLGPLEQLLQDKDVSEIMVISPSHIYVEKKGVLEKTSLRFSSDESIRTVIERIITPLGRRIDESSPMVDARLPDGSRVNAIIPPLAIRGPSITIRKFSDTPLTVNDLINFGTLTKEMADLLKAAVKAKKNIIISGGTGSGKTTLLNVLSSAIPENERIVTIEDAAELNLPQEHVVPLESRPPNLEGKGEITIRDLVKNALRMRPDRIVVGECRGGEALDMLQAMNTGHDGSLTTTHANSPPEAISRLETLCLMSGIDLPSKAIREQIVSAVDIIVQQSRLADGKRRITSISEVVDMDENGRIRLSEIFKYVPKNLMADEKFAATGWLPGFTLSEKNIHKIEVTN